MEKRPYRKPDFQQKSSQEIVRKLFELAGQSKVAAEVLKECISEPNPVHERQESPTAGRPRSDE